MGKVSLMGVSVILWAKEQWWFGEKRLALECWGVTEKPRAGVGLEKQPQESATDVGSDAMGGHRSCPAHLSASSFHPRLLWRGLTRHLALGEYSLVAGDTCRQIIRAKTRLSKATWELRALHHSDTILSGTMWVSECHPPVPSLPHFAE